eukprot:1867309-Amphidinium_carterae.1
MEVLRNVLQFSVILTVTIAGPTRLKGIFQRRMCLRAITSLSTCLIGISSCQLQLHIPMHERWIDMGQYGTPVENHSTECELSLAAKFQP